MNISLMFPGVGSQYTGMGKPYYEQYEIIRETFEEASRIVQMDIASLCFEEQRKSELVTLANAQICIFTLSMAYYRLLIKRCPHLAPVFYCGYSLGEYSALCSAGAMSFSDTLKLIESRSTILQKITDSKIGMMIWVIELDAGVTEQICKDLRNSGYHVYISGYNSNKQVSVSGDNQSIHKAIIDFEDYGAIVVPLELSGPYHCELMREAYDYMQNAIRGYSFYTANTTVIANWDASLYSDGHYEQYLINQLISPICWDQTMHKIYNANPDLIIEVGPKEVLTYISKKNPNTAFTISLDRLENLERICELYENNRMY